MFEHSIRSNHLMPDSAIVLGEGSSKPKTHQLDTISNHMLTLAHHALAQAVHELGVAVVAGNTE